MPEMCEKKRLSMFLHIICFLNFGISWRLEANLKNEIKKTHINKRIGANIQILVMNMLAYFKKMLLLI